MKHVCGLDFGTSNSTVSVMHGQQPALLPLEDGKPTLPSSLFFNFEDGQTIAGRAALAEYLAGSQGRLLRALKSVLGSSLMHETTQIKQRRLGFAEIIALYIGQLKQRAEAAHGHLFTHVVLGRPVHFDDDDPTRDALAQSQLKAAAATQGFTHIEFQYEPIAAALAYEQQLALEQLALVADIGGGTADFALVRLGPNRAKLASRSADILGSTGVHLGGTDFDKLLNLACIMPHLGLGSVVREKGTELPRTLYNTLATWHRINSLYTPATLLEVRQLAAEAAQPELVQRLHAVLQHRQGHNLALATEAAKQDLSTATWTTRNVMLGAEAIAIPFTQAGLNATLAQPFGRIAACAQAVLQQAGVNSSQVQALFLTGGSAQIPALQQQLQQLVPQAQLVAGDMFGSVGLGLALEAQRRFGA